MNWKSLLAGRAASIKPSPFVDLGAIWSVPDLVFFAGGTPPPERVPVDRLRQATAGVWEEAAAISGYGDGQGYPPLRELIAGRMAARGVSVDPSHLLITNGSQQGLDLVARALFAPGDRVIVEGPTYFGALQAFDAYQVEYLVAPTDELGLIPGALEDLLSGAGRVKALYTVSIFQNPTGATITPERQQTILDIARRAGIAVIEDDPYGELRFEGASPNPLRSLDSDVIYLGTFSKTLMPSLRIGWMAIPDALRPVVVDGKEAVDIQSDRFAQRAIVSAAQDGWLDRHIDESRALYRRRCRHMLAALEREMHAGVSWTIPEGGFFIWLTLPASLTADDLLPLAAENAVGYLPGSFFYPDRRRVPNLRLGFSTLPEDRIDQGIARLATAIGQTLP